MAYFNREELKTALKYWYEHLEVNNQEQNEAAWCAINAIRYCIAYDSEYSDDYKSCKGCKYYSYGCLNGYPCINCQRNFTLVDEIREQKNDLWKDGASNG